MKLLLISTSNTLEGEHILLRKMFDAGLETLHVRKPKLSTEALKKYLEGFSEEYHKKIIIHTHHNLLWDFNLKGIHLTKSHKKHPYKMWAQHQLFKLRRKGIIRTTSCSSLSSLAESYAEFEYIMLSPIFAGTQEHRPTFSRGTLDTIMTKFPKKVIARGGANVNSIEKAREIGFSGVAFHNAIWHHQDPVQAFEDIMNRYKELGLSLD